MLSTSELQHYYHPFKFPHQQSMSTSPSPKIPISTKRGAVRKVVEEGWSVAEAARHFGISRTWLSEIVKRYQQQGRSGLRPSRHGAILTKLEQVQLLETIVRASPESVLMSSPKVKFELWSWPAVQTLARVKLKVQLSRASVIRYLQLWQLWPERPSPNASTAQNILNRFRNFGRSQETTGHGSASVWVAWSRPPRRLSFGLQRYRIVTAVLKHRVRYFALYPDYDQRQGWPLLGDFLERLDAASGASLDIALPYHPNHTQRNLLEKIHVGSSSRVVVIHSPDRILDVFELRPAAESSQSR